MDRKGRRRQDLPLFCGGGALLYAGVATGAVTVDIDGARGGRGEDLTNGDARLASSSATTGDDSRSSGPGYATISPRRSLESSPRSSRRSLAFAAEECDEMFEECWFAKFLECLGRDCDESEKSCRLHCRKAGKKICRRPRNKCRAKALAQEQQGGKLLTMFESKRERPATSDSYNSDSYNVYYGYLHSHTSVSDGVGTPEEAFDAARNAGLDFFSLSEHDYYPRDMTNDAWNYIKSVADEKNEDGEFVAFWGFEWTSDSADWQVDGKALGHITVTATPDFCHSGHGETDSLNEFVRWIDGQADGVAILAHPGYYSTGFSRFDFDHSERIIGMELWNKNTDYYNKDGYTENNDLGPYDEALKMGWRIGATGGQDNHVADWGTKNDYRMGVLANERTRGAILDAMKKRRFFSTRDKHLSLSFECNGTQMGGVVRAGRLACTIKVNRVGGIISRLLVVQNDYIVMERWPDSSSFTRKFDFNTRAGDYLYIRVDGSSGGWRAISSPIFVERGRGRNARGIMCLG